MHTSKRGGNYINYGVSEFGMSLVIMNGIALHGGFISLWRNLLMFYEYAHNAVRYGGINETTHFIRLYSADWIGLGEDGPTHQPVGAKTDIIRLIQILKHGVQVTKVESAIAWQ